MIDKEVVQELAKQRAFGFRKLVAFGSSFAITIPKFWVKNYCVEIDGDYYFKMTVDGITLTLNPITEDDIKDIKIIKKDTVQ